MPSNGAGTATIWETIVALGFSYNFSPCYDAGSGQEPQHACWIVWNLASLICTSVTISVQTLWSWAQPQKLPLHRRGSSIYTFTFDGEVSFGQLKYLMEHSRNPTVFSFRWCTILRSLRYSLTAPLWPRGMWIIPWLAGPYCLWSLAVGGLIGSTAALGVAQHCVPASSCLVVPTLPQALHRCPHSSGHCKKTD